MSLATHHNRASPGKMHTSTELRVRKALMELAMSIGKSGKVSVASQEMSYGCCVGLNNFLSCVCLQSVFPCCGVCVHICVKECSVPMQ